MSGHRAQGTKSGLWGILALCLCEPLDFLRFPLLFCEMYTVKYLSVAERR